MLATVTLKEGLSYRYKGYVFSPTPATVTDPKDVAYLQTISCLNVRVQENGTAPVKKAAAPPAPPPAPPLDNGGSNDIGDGDELDVDSAETVPAIPKGKPGPKPKAK